MKQRLKTSSMAGLIPAKLHSIVLTAQMNTKTVTLNKGWQNNTTFFPQFLNKLKCNKNP